MINRSVTSAPRPARAAPRGYVLLEVTLVFTVAILLSGLLFSIYNEMEKNRRVQTVERDIANAKDAIINYALLNRSSTFYYHEFSATQPVTVIYWRVPADRPFLPCPDITGDGLEDRIVHNNRAGGTIAIDIAINIHHAHEVDGECFRQKGWLPYRTLDLPSNDPWGNRYTYRVDRNFSQGIFGFNQETRPDHSSYVKPVRVGDPGSTGTTIAYRQYYANNAQRRLTPDATNSSSEMQLVWGAAGVNSHIDPSIVCRRAPCGAGHTASEPIAGFLNDSTPNPGYSGGYNTSQPIHSVIDGGAVSEGLPFVILSHGENGLGALIHRTAPTPGSPASAADLQCHGIFGASPGEIQNAMFIEGIGGCPAVVPSQGNEGGFVAHPPSQKPHSLSPATDPEADEGFDDIVGWMTRQELVDELNRIGALPAANLPLFGGDLIGPPPSP